MYGLGSNSMNQYRMHPGLQYKCESGGKLMTAFFKPSRLV